MEQYLLGIDIGTSACKVAVFDQEGNVKASASREYPVYYPRSGYAEQNPDDWWNAVCSTIRGIIESGRVKADQIAGIGIDGQSWSAIPVDRNGEVLTRTPIWMDVRSQEICDRLNQEIGEDTILNLCGNALQPSYTTAKILWYKENLPDVFAHTVKILQSNSFIAYRFTGNLSQDLSQGYGLHCFDMKKGTWDEEMCERLGIPASFLPELFPCHAVVGTVTDRAAKESGLLAGIPVVAGGLDAACGTLGAGVLKDGETQEQGGQAGGMSICMSECKTDKRLIMSFHVAPDRWLLQGGTTGGGGVMRWLERELGDYERAAKDQTKKHPLTVFNELAEQVPPGSEGLLFLPYMAGERSPIWDINAKGVYYGLDFSKTKGHLIRAAMEGVAFSLRHNLDVAEEAGAKVKELRAMGGSANSLLWTQIKADITGKRIVVPSSDTATTLGAVILAGVGIGMYQSFEDAVNKTVQIKRFHEPSVKAHRQYENNYHTYRKLYENLRELMKETGGK